MNNGDGSAPLAPLSVYGQFIQITERQRGDEIKKITWINEQKSITNTDDHEVV